MVCGMEESTIIIILGVVFMAIFTGFNLIKRQNPAKKAQKKAEMSVWENLTEYREVEKQTIADIIHQKDSQIKSLNAKIKLLEPELIEEEKPGKKQITFEEIQAYVKQNHPKYSALLIIPGVKKQILQATKGMTIQEAMELIRQFTGDQKPGGPDQNSISQEFRTDYA